MNLKHIIRDIGYFGLGAAAVLVEAGEKAARSLIRKGQRTWADNQDTVEAVRQKAQELYEKAKEKMEAPEADPAEDFEIRSAEDVPTEDAPDAACESDADRESDADGEPAAGCEPDADSDPECPCVPEPSIEEPLRPTPPEVIYHAPPAPGTPADPIVEDDPDTPSPADFPNG